MIPFTFFSLFKELSLLDTTIPLARDAHSLLSNQIVHLVWHINQPFNPYTP
jgi:hypothetical protein